MVPPGFVGAKARSSPETGTTGAMPAGPVTVETPRLVLRPLRADDAPALHAAVYADPAVTWDGTTSSLDEARAALDAKLAHYDEHGFGMLAAVDRADGALLGFGGLQHMEG